MQCRGKVVLSFQRLHLTMFEFQACAKVTCGKWVTGYNFGIDDNAESKFGTRKELIVLNIWKSKHCFN